MPSFSLVSISALTSSSVRPRMRALTKLPASISADAGKPAGRLSTRFSTWPSSPTRTTSARSGSSCTNSTCFSRGFDFAVSTTPAARLKPESRPEASVSTASTDFGLARGRDLRLDRLAVLFGEIADLHQRVDEEAQSELGRQPARGRVRRINEAELFQIGHDVAHRGRRQRHRQNARQIARAYWLAGRQIALDDLAKDFARTLVELGEAQLVRGERKVMAGQGCPR